MLTMDGVGEWATTSLASASGNELKMHQGDPLPAFARAALLGLHLLHRVQGQFRRIQAHGPRALWRAEICAEAILDNLIDLKSDGTFRLDLSYFDYCTGLTMTNEQFDELFGGPARDAARNC